MYDIQVQFGSNLLLQKFGVPYLKILLYRVLPKALRFFWYLEVLFGEIQLYYYGPSLFKLNIYLLERQRTGNGRWKEWDWAPIQWLLLEGYNSPGPGWGCHCCHSGLLLVGAGGVSLHRWDLCSWTLNLRNCGAKPTFFVKVQPWVLNPSSWDYTETLVFCHPETLLSCTWLLFPAILFT